MAVTIGQFEIRSTWARGQRFQASRPASFPAARRDATRSTAPLPIGQPQHGTSDTLAGGDWWFRVRFGDRGAFRGRVLMRLEEPRRLDRLIDAPGESDVVAARADLRARRRVAGGTGGGERRQG